MAKVTNYNFSLHTGKINKHFNVDVFYTSDEGFYIPVHPSYKDKAHNIYDKLKKEFNAAQRFKTKRSRSHDPNDYTLIITGSTEQKVKDNFYAAMQLIVNSAMIERPVIIIFFVPNRTNYGGHIENDEHQKIGFQFSLTYAIEVTTPDAPDDKKYYQVKQHEFLGKKEETKREINLWGGGTTVVIDTPENRKFLETLYKNLDALEKKVKEFTTSEKTVLDFIQSKKLLTFKN